MGDVGVGDTGVGLIVDQGEFEDVISRIKKADRYALDTEFHRERS